MAVFVAIRLKKGESMENTTKANVFHISGTKILYLISLAVFTCVVSRGPLLEDSFIAGISLIAYMMSRSVLNMYLVVPAAAGILSYISRGYDPWAYIGAMVLCGLIFAVARNVQLNMRQRGVVVFSVTIISISLYRLVTHTAYMTSPAELMIEGSIAFVLTYVFKVFFDMAEGRGTERNSREISLASFMTVCLMIINGMGIMFLIWVSIVFAALWAVVCLDAGKALFVTIAGGLVAELIGEGQWGIMVTVMLAVFAASYAKKHSVVLMVIIFAAACWGAGFIENGIVLGLDKYCIFLPAAVFAALYWRFPAGMKRIMLTAAGENGYAGKDPDKCMNDILKDKASQMKELAALYATYIDNRSMLADQFEMTAQVIEDAGWRVSRQGRKAARKEREKIDVDIAVSQCAASGTINGDCCGWQEIGDGRVAMVISDGMGKGKKAAAESLMVTKTMLSLLRSGVSVDMALKRINRIMLMKENEDSYATLDMVTIDKCSGKAKFYKIGAAPTLIRRRSNVEEVRLSAVPLGIVNGLKVKYVETALKKGDWIIMMSDGVSDGGEKIKKAAAGIRSLDPQTMSDLLINQAADSYIGKERDDLSVMVARIL